MNEFSFYKILKRGALSGVVFTIIWSSWAYMANLDNGHELAIRAATTQGGFSIVNAFVYTVLMEYMFSIGRTRNRRFVLAFLLPNVLLTFCLTFIHVVRQTPNVAITIAPTLMVVYMLSLIYVVSTGPKKLKSSPKQVAKR